MWTKIQPPSLSFASQGKKNQVRQSLDEVDPRIVDWAVKIEDKRFWQHQGIDWLASLRAMRKNAIALKLVEGASTLDQQVVKLYHQNFAQRTLKTKLNEALAALKLNQNYNKDQILLWWINNVQFSH